MKITKREVLFSIVIACTMLIIGIVIAGNINDAVMEKQQEYITALQINNDKELFEYGMRTNVGNAFIYGELKAVDTVTFDEIGGEYSYVEKVKERYTKHTRTVTYKDSNGKTKRKTETYWTWDRVDSWDKHSEKITFLDVEFDYGMINFPLTDYICTIKESSKIRYKYYGDPTYSIGTIYTHLKDRTISNSYMYHGSTIEEALESATTNWGVGIFWICWIALTGGIVYGFYYIDNRWLEDNYKKRYY